VPTPQTLFAALVVALLPLVAQARPAVAIIIDDLGYALEAGRRAVALPGPVVCSVLPHTPHGRDLSELAHAAGKEVLLHLPMQAMATDSADEPGRLELDMTRDAFSRTLEENLASVPYIMGVNGHRGSLLTRHPGHMAWLMEGIVGRGLVFVDSYTTHHSVALMLAREAGIPATRRHVFLDGDTTPAALAGEFERMIRLAQARGHAVAIGHPHAATLAFLESALPTLSDRGVDLVGLRQLLAIAGAVRVSQSGPDTDRPRSHTAGSP